MTAIAVIIAGIVLSSLYQRTVQRTFDELLEVHLANLFGAISNTEAPPEDFAGTILEGEPRFLQPLSGWYWQLSQDGDGLAGSRSLVFTYLSVSEDNGNRGADGVLHFTRVGLAGELLRGISEDVTFPNGTGTYQLIVSGNATALSGEIGSFRISVIITLGVFALGLILATFVQARFGLRPLDQVRRGLADLRSGKETRFEGPFPSEIEPLAAELNQLLESNQQIIERARTQVGNLAHALKTPLSVITNEARAGSGPVAEKVAEQADVMRQQITHYLDRARIAARSRVIGAVTKVEPVIARLARAMTRIYDEQGIAVAFTVPDGVAFKGEQQDLEEIIGNLADNACKWAATAVMITVVRDGKDVGGGMLAFRIDDDGPGVAPEKRAEATRRGKRLDESKPGSGLGLSIVSDLVALYQGRFTLGESPTGGLRAEVILPAA